MNSLPFTTYHQTIEYLFNLKTFGIRFGLEEFKLLLKRLNNPQERLKLILVGGTNGKGSTCAILSAILKESGYKVGLYTSPHLEEFTERIRVNDEDIHEEDVVTLCNRIKNTIDEIGSRFCITFFEFVTAMAFIYFLERAVDVAIFEVGMGGRLDATNVARPIASVITNISREHEAILGKEILDIAREKSGIVKKGSVLITGVRDPFILKSLKEVCHNMDAKIKVIDEDYSVTIKKSGSFTYNGYKVVFKNLHTNLKGRHQYENASQALATLEVLEEKGIRVGEKAVRRGLEYVLWPGRLEMVTTHLNRMVLLDCAHNPAAAKTLQEFLLEKNNTKRLVMVLGIMKDKDVEGIVSILTPVADHIIVTRPKDERSMPLDILSQVVSRYNPKVETIDEVGKACHYAISLLEEGELMCVTGSIFTVGGARRFLKRSYGIFQ
ncbi:MAG: bifunctional folylpolyglutamate synthase/dihydrofolate synthase [Thermodesulfobacteriota bacterium]